MNTKIFLTVFFIEILYFELSYGLTCYQHDYCLGGCPRLESSKVQCTSENSKCWKLSSPLGVKRGCGDYRCTVQVDTSLMGTASICCPTNLCNSAISMQTQTMISIALASLSAYMCI